MSRVMSKLRAGLPRRVRAIESGRARDRLEYVAAMSEPIRDRDDNDSPSIIGAGVSASLPTRDEAEAAWRSAVAARFVELAVLDVASAHACAAAMDVDLSVDPSTAADHEIMYWDAE